MAASCGTRRCVPRLRPRFGVRRPNAASRRFNEPGRATEPRNRPESSWTWIRKAVRPTLGSLESATSMHINDGRVQLGNFSNPHNQRICRRFQIITESAVSTRGGTERDPLQPSRFREPVLSCLVVRIGFFLVQKECARLKSLSYDAGTSQGRRMIESDKSVAQLTCGLQNRAAISPRICDEPVSDICRPASSRTPGFRPIPALPLHSSADECGIDMV